MASKWISKRDVRIFRATGVDSGGRKEKAKTPPIVEKTDYCDPLRKLIRVAYEKGTELSGGTD
ncbi:hypothetical protein [Cohnella abietis]|nr:hypothetical protein [Cohnella abietis]